MNPLIDITTLSDEEIVNRINKAYKYLEMQTTLGHTPTVESIKSVIETLEIEKSRRMAQSQSDEFRKKYPKDLDPIDIGTIDT